MITVKEHVLLSLMHLCQVHSGHRYVGYLLQDLQGFQFLAWFSNEIA